MLKVTFIAHAGISIKNGKGESVLIDPWFTDSTVKKPVVQALLGYPTIDFQIPKTQEKIEEYSPDVILVSHFHAHHAPHDDILTLASQSEKIVFGHPDIELKNAAAKAIFEILPQVEVKPCGDKDSFSVGSFQITALTHTVPEHTAWLVESEGNSVLHVADARANRDLNLRNLDEAWNEFSDLKPDLFFTGAAGNSKRVENDGVRSVQESLALSPVEASKLTQLVNPKVVSLIGCYNHSVFKGKIEYIAYAPAVEEEFAWASSWLAPSSKFVPARPGHVYTIGLGQDLGDTVI